MQPHVLFSSSALVAGIILALFVASGTSIAEGRRMTLASPDFAYGGAIPAPFSCDGAGISPELSWSDPPAGTRSFALIVSDTDVSKDGFAHWVLYDIAPEVTRLPRGASTGILPPGSEQGLNGKGERGWTPPCPPGGTHHYRFQLFALNQELARGSPTEMALLVAMHGHILQTATLRGTYTKTAETPTGSPR